MSSAEDLKKPVKAREMERKHKRHHRSGNFLLQCTACAKLRILMCISFDVTALFETTSMTGAPLCNSWAGARWRAIPATATDLP